MSFAPDSDFDKPWEKVASSVDPSWSSSQSKLASTSLLFGILGVTLLPLIGSVVAIANGHAALGEILESEGSIKGAPRARAGLFLGYFAFVAILVVGLAFFVVGPSSARIAMMSPATAVESQPAVKMINQMNQADFQMVEDGGISWKTGDILAFYTAGKPRNVAEFAVLTRTELIYLNEGRKTVMELKDVVSFMDDSVFQETYNVMQLPGGKVRSHYEFTSYHIEVRIGTTRRMTLNIKPREDGVIFFQALTSALEKAGVTIPPTPTPK